MTGGYHNKTLPPHCPYNLKINLEEGTQPPVGPIYSLSASEQEALKEFIEENLNMSNVKIEESRLDLFLFSFFYFLSF